MFLKKMKDDLISIHHLTEWHIAFLKEFLYNTIITTKEVLKGFRPDESLFYYLFSGIPVFLLVD